MATVTEIVTGALQLLEVKTAEAAIEPNEAEDGLSSLNDLMGEWNLEGINIGYETLDDIEDELFITPGSEGAVKSNLAVYIAPEYGRVVTPSLLRRANRSKNVIRGSIQLRRAQFPDTLPIGSGNEDTNFVADGDSAGNLLNSKFYPSNEEGQCN